MNITSSDPHLLEYSKKQEIKKSKTFSRILNSRSRRKKYSKDESGINFHNGQRKLLLSEVEFITNEYDKFDDNEKKIILYIGASAGINSVHTYYLVKMFPEFEYHFYDKNSFFPKLYSLENVIIFKRYFTEDDYKTYKNKNVFLICDLRDLAIGNAKKKENLNELNKIILDDITFQRQIYENIQPKSALLKFRLPWKKDTTEYLDGTIYYQCWQGPYSTETRLVPNGKIKKYDNTSYEERLFYFNTETRRRYYEHPCKCYGHCYDCTSEFIILSNYIKKFNKKICICELGKEITEYLTFLNPKKVLFKNPPLNKYHI